MGNGTQLVFNPFVLDTPNQSLLRGTEKIFLRPKTFAVLDFLVRNPHRLVTKDEMMATLWPGTKVVDAALRGQHSGDSGGACWNDGAGSKGKPFCNLKGRVTERSQTGVEGKKRENKLLYK
jgi:hypothetical protein